MGNEPKKTIEDQKNKKENQIKNKNDNNKNLQSKNPININKNVSNLNNNNITNENSSEIFNKINIFNSILIMMNNISYMNEYFSKLEIKDTISDCENHNQPFCLTSILYYINKFMWNNNDKDLIGKNDLNKKYSNYFNTFSNNNSKNANYEKFCYDIKNAGFILQSIYSTINTELTKEKKKPFKPKFNEKHPILSNYYNSFFEKNNSKISDLFIGHYVIQTICQNCQSKIHKYNYFYYLNFDSNNINKYSINNNPLQMSCMNFNNNFMINPMMNNNFMNVNPLGISYNNVPNNTNYTNNQNINITDYFNNIIPKCFNKKYQIFCNVCCMNTYYEDIYNIYSLPNILSLEFSNNEKCNFILQDELNLQKCTQFYPDKSNGIYKLISIICQISYNMKFICYCFNHKKCLWYSYTDGSINEIEKMDINAIPILAFYQCGTNLENYKKIEIENVDKICLNIRLLSGDKKIFFNKNSTIGKLKQYISSTFKPGNITRLLINGEIADNNKILSEYQNNITNDLNVIVQLG